MLVNSVVEKIFYMSFESQSKKIHAAIGVIYHPEDKNLILAAKRSVDQSYAGYWGLPGGKIEPDEDPQLALHRELHEEVDITVLESEFIGTVRHNYPGFSVTLEIYKVIDYTGQVFNKEGQELTWIAADKLHDLQPQLAASCKIIELLLS